MLQGHDEQQCYMEHPELYPKKEKNRMEVDAKEETENKYNREKGSDRMEERSAPHQIEIINKFEEPKTKKGGWRKQPKRVWAKVDIPTGNKFEALEKEEKEGEMVENFTRGESQASDRPSAHAVKESSKEWVEGSFGKQDKRTSPGAQGSHTNIEAEKVHALEKDQQQDNNVLISDEVTKNNDPEIKLTKDLIPFFGAELVELVAGGFMEVVVW
ncbi:hypothetical protein KY289_035789 [Solanum tuberosum]|nr:hypothetical protein KY289_035789 [Solanum tuberosum]